MKYEIKHRLSGEILFSIEASTWKLAVEAAVKDGADLSGANLSGANLSGADLSGANLSWAHLSGANLSGANLSGANLSWAHLSGADLSGANLSGANLSWAHLSWAHLSWADLSGANLSGANLSGANLSGAKIKKTRWPQPTIVLTACWTVSAKLSLSLMRYDASNHPKPKRFLEWAKDGNCPYDGLNFQRCANFNEQRGLIKPGFLRLKVRSAYELAVAVLKECCEGYEE